ncbi:MAG: patatin-like phospholipase family protein [Bacteroidetes bacterium]|nr:MAG: patatin-like phospholipase family protein [Bacteroidota bacterium]
MKSNYELIKEARVLLKCPDLDLLKAEPLAGELKNRSCFAYAAELYTRILELKTSKAARDKVRRNLAICLYKDPDLPAATKFRLAEEHLSKVGKGDLSKTRDTEVLGLMGAIYKRKWQYDSQFKNLLTARHYYKRGYDEWHRKHTGPYDPNTDGDAGYTAINYAFILDLLAVVRVEEAVKLKDQDVLSAKGWLEEAESIRRQLIRYLDGDNLFRQHKTGAGYSHWVYATLGEAYFALREVQKARHFYDQYRRYEEQPKPWEIETTSRQLRTLGELQIRLLPGGLEADELVAKKTSIIHQVKECLAALYPGEDKEPPLVAAWNGKTGLALSGGGFRASFFHIGVLAKLAELNVLRHVEVLSCVSGGSILGAYYYLLLRQRLEAKPESGINALSRQDYVEVVEYMVDQFRKDVRNNLRIRILSSWWYNLRIFFNPNYTRTHRLAELYEKFLYKKLVNDGDVAPKAPIYMQNIKIKPFGHGAAFNPKTDNWNRNYKVPMLVLNATSMNTGHNWQFTASWMGEPPANIQPDVDSKPRLRRMYYNEAPEPYTNKIRLGQAVGASSAVPGLFEPLLLRGLYPDVDLRLADGGVHDNQGVASLLEQECNIMLISDASGQLTAEADTGAGVTGSVLRSDMILQERVRESQLLDLKVRESNAQLNGLLFVHLKKDLNENPKKWIGCNDPTRAVWLTMEDDSNKDMTSYKILKDVQQGVASLRTDLDAFTDAEVFSLMYSGYQQAGYTFGKQNLDALFPPDENGAPATHPWAFLDVAPWMQDNNIKPSLLRRLKIGANIPLKVFQINWAMATLGIFLAAIPMLAVLYLLWRYRDQPIILELPVKALGITVLLFLLDFFVSSMISKIYNWKSTIIKKLLSVIGTGLVALVSQLYLLFLNPIFLRDGELQNMEREDRFRNFLKRLAGIFK